MDDEKEKNVRLCCAVASAIIIMLVTYFGMLYHPHRMPIPREPSELGIYIARIHKSYFERV